MQEYESTVGFTITSIFLFWAGRSRPRIASHTKRRLFTHEFRMAAVCVSMAVFHRSLPGSIILVALAVVGTYLPWYSLILYPFRHMRQRPYVFLLVVAFWWSVFLFIAAVNL